MRIRAQALNKTFRDADRELTIIESLDFDFVGPGAFAIVGRSGIGKSTLLHLLGGLDHPSHGAVSYDEVCLSTLGMDALDTFRGATVGFVFQQHNLLAEFCAWENVAMPLLIAGVPEPQARIRASDTLKKVGLGERLLHRPGQLSGGEQQRVAIARAVVAEPKVILADEPTGSLDFETALQVQQLLFSVQRDLNNVLIIVTHNLELAHATDLVLEMLPGGGLRVIAQ